MPTLDDDRIRLVVPTDWFTIINEEVDAVLAAGLPCKWTTYPNGARCGWVERSTLDMIINYNLYVKDQFADLTLTDWMLRACSSLTT